MSCPRLRRQRSRSTAGRSLALSSDRWVARSAPVRAGGRGAWELAGAGRAVCPLPPGPSAARVCRRSVSERRFAPNPAVLRDYSGCEAGARCSYLSLSGPVARRRGPAYSASRVLLCGAEWQGSREQTLLCVLGSVPEGAPRRDSRWCFRETRAKLRDGLAAPGTSRPLVIPDCQGVVGSGPAHFHSSLVPSGHGQLRVENQVDAICGSSSRFPAV
jgi:hypothetical protein